MKKYKAILFDMDGTLTDSAPGITRGVAYTLKKYGIEPPELDELKKFIGPPLGESFEKYYGIDRKNFLETERIFREYYDTTGIFENSLFDGVTEMLAGLKKADKFIATASSKPIMHVKRIIEHFGIAEFFDYIGAADFDNGIIEKEDVLSKLLADTKLLPSECLMVGDRLYDIKGAHKNSIDCMCVLYGFGSRKEFGEYGADYVAETVEELSAFLLAT